LILYFNELKLKEKKRFKHKYYYYTNIFNKLYKIEKVKFIELKNILIILVYFSNNFFFFFFFFFFFLLRYSLLSTIKKLIYN